MGAPNCANILAGLALCALAGCSSGTSSSSSSTQTPTGTYPAAVALADTIFLGDQITLDWTYPASGTLYGIVGGDFAQFATNYGAGICVSGCTPSGFQAILATEPHYKRVVILIGTFDALQATACGGAGMDSGTVAGNYEAIVNTAHTLGLQVFVGTIPPIENGFGTAACNAQVTTLNQQISAMAQQTGAYVVNYNAALTSAADFTSTGVNAGIVPSTAGYALMQSAYATSAGGLP